MRIFVERERNDVSFADRASFRSLQSRTYWSIALWQAGILDEIPGVWLAIGAIVAIGFGIMLAVASSPKVTATTTRDLS